MRLFTRRLRATWERSIDRSKIASLGDVRSADERRREDDAEIERLG